MKLEKIYEKLDGLSTVIHATNLELVKREIQELKNEIRTSILKSENKTSSKTRLNTMLRVAKKAGNRRPVLENTIIDDNGLQIFTDSYFLVKLSEDDQNLAMKSEVSNDMYPRTDRVIELATQGELLSFKVLVNDILNEMKLSDTILFKRPSNSYGDKIIGMQKENLKNFITFMNYRPQDYIEFNFIDNSDSIENSDLRAIVKPLHTTKENGTFGLILPIRLGTLPDDIKFVETFEV